MGKRKERRLAAKIGAGRRVKLDLFAEPSGNFLSPRVFGSYFFLYFLFEIY